MEAMDEHVRENHLENWIKFWFPVECYRQTGSFDIISDVGLVKAHIINSLIVWSKELW